MRAESSSALRALAETGQARVEETGQGAPEPGPEKPGAGKTGGWKNRGAMT